MIYFQQIKLPRLDKYNFKRKLVKRAFGLGQHKYMDMPGTWGCRTHLCPLEASTQDTSLLGNSLAVQWLGRHTSTAGRTGLIPGQGAKFPQAMGPKKKKKIPHFHNGIFFF